MLIFKSKIISIYWSYVKQQWQFLQRACEEVMGYIEYLDLVLHCLQGCSVMDR